MIASCQVIAFQKKIDYYFGMRVQSELEMLAWGANFAAACHIPLIVYLLGPLGAGKTTFVRGFIEALGFKGAVKSPTYTLVETYNFKKCKVCHFDLYRIQDPEELELIGIRDYCGNNTICLIEWPNYGESKIPQPDIICTIDFAAEQRILNFKSCSSIGENILKKIVK